MGSNRKGDRYERELVNALREAGFGAQRTPSSGSSTDRELPDIVAGRGDLPAMDGRLKSSPSEWPATNVVGIEHKSGNATTMYVDENEVAELQEWGEVWHARVLLGCRPTDGTSPKLHYLAPPENARRTQGDDEGNYGLPVADIEDRAVMVVNATDGTVEVVA